MARKILEIEINTNTPQDELELCVIAAERTSDINMQRQASKAPAGDRKKPKRQLKSDDNLKGD